MSFIEMMMEKDALTENGAITHSTTSNFNLDLFFLAGACRNESEENIQNILTKSYAQDRIKTLKIIFWAGDIREGAGERRFFKLALNWLYNHYKTDLLNYLNYIPEFSRWDVLFDFIDDPSVMDYVLSEFKKGNALLCKWLPRKVKVTDKYKTEKVEKSGKSTTKVIVTKTKTRLVKDGIALKIRKALNWNEKQYRQHLVKYTNVVETKMCDKKWNEIEYSKVPSVAMNKYNKAWYRNDEARFKQYLESVNKGEAKINASAIFPHDIIKNGIEFGGWSITIRGLNQGQITQWNNLPNYLSGINEIIPVVDTSGSMYCNNGLPASIGLSLGLYISERNIGPFKDAFITFSGEPEMQYLKGDINQRLTQLAHASWGSNTNLSRVFEIILNKAISSHLPENEMPKTVLVISDMEFDCCGNLTNYEYIKQRYINAGYEVPNIVFWNVNGRVGNCPVKMNQNRVALVSGASPSIIKSVLSGDINPLKIMDNTIEKERYSFIK